VSLSATPPIDQPVAIHSSRLWALLTFQFTHFIFPMRMSADSRGVSMHQVRFWLTPWSRTDEHLPMSHVAEVELDRGLLWDAIRVESSGGIDPLRIAGLSKFHSGSFVESLRGMMGK
jgi:hypothetical protein